MTMTICPACDRPAHTEDITDGLCPDCRDNATAHELRAEVKRLQAIVDVAQQMVDDADPGYDVLASYQLDKLRAAIGRPVPLGRTAPAAAEERTS